MIGELAALITACFWSTSSIAFTEASVRVGPMYVNVTRMIFAVIFLLITILIISAPINLSFAQIIYLVISGFVGLTIGDTYLFKAFKSIGARLSMLVMSSVPVISTILAFIFLDERISFSGIVGMCITISGITIVIVQREEKPASKYKIEFAGIIFALIGAVGQAVGLIFARFAFDIGEINGFVATIVRVFSALIITYILAASTKRFSNPIKVYKQNPKGLTFTIIGSIFGPYLGITFSLISITYAKIGVASTIMATVPIIMLPLVRYYYKEKLSPISIFGAILAVSGVALLFLNQ
jgi:drug/metabolite transporter (DMT)-like permease